MKVRIPYSSSPPPRFPKFRYPRKYKVENDAARSAAGNFGIFVTHNMNRKTIEIVSFRAASSRIIVVEILDGCSIPTDIGVVLVP